MRTRSHPRGGAPTRRHAAFTGTSWMGRVGIEPTTLGLRVPPKERHRTAGNGIPLQTDAPRHPANGDELQPTEPNAYAHSYAHVVFSSRRLTFPSCFATPAPLSGADRMLGPYIPPAWTMLL